MFYVVELSLCRNRVGHAKPLDHICEIFVGLLKRALKAGGVSPEVILKHSKNSVFMLRLLEGMKRILHLGKRASTHSHAWPQDELGKMAAFLIEQKVFVFTPGRQLSGIVDDVETKSYAVAHEFLSKFLSDKLEPVTESEHEADKLSDSHMMDDVAEDFMSMMDKDEMEVVDEKKE
jgi:hypothetical protein